jgi:hypothetical protein
MRRSHLEVLVTIIFLLLMALLTSKVSINPTKLVVVTINTNPSMKSNVTNVISKNFNNIKNTKIRHFAEILCSSGWRNSCKLYHLLNHLETLSDNDVLLFVDGLDTFIIGDLSNILEKFRGFESKIVIGGERNRFPKNIGDDQLYNKSKALIYPNSGCLIGYVKALRNILNGVLVDIEKRIDSDQAFWMQQHILNSDIVIDHDGEICLSMARILLDELIFHNRSSVEFLRTHTYPNVIHFNGGSKSGISEFKSKLESSSLQ